MAGGGGRAGGRGGTISEGVGIRKGKGREGMVLVLRLLTAMHACVCELVLTLQCCQTSFALQNLDWLSCVVTMLHGLSSCCYVFALEFNDFAWWGSRDFSTGMSYPGTRTLVKMLFRDCLHKSPKP